MSLAAGPNEIFMLLSANAWEGICDLLRKARLFFLWGSYGVHKRDGMEAYLGT